MSALLWWCDFTYTICSVTLPTERVSWNFVPKCPLYRIRVTLPTERVSWNWYNSDIVLFCSVSRSPRSVWVEIFILRYAKIQNRVTLPTERVSWNLHGAVSLFRLLRSRSPRSVWVEIQLQSKYAFLKVGHAPHGACELKSQSY